jgi:hypothetical protein
MSKISILILSLIAYLLTACSTIPTTPRNTENLCAIFKQKHNWYNASNATYKKWGVPVPVQMAIMHQESHFVADAAPPSGFFSWLGFGGSSAYGYPQAKDETWDDYQRKSGNSSAQRDKFSDACDFIGWYSQISYKKLGIAKTDARNLYLAYHEGHGGFKKESYNQKPWLLQISNTVAQRAQQFERQLGACGLR